MKTRRFIPIVLFLFLLAGCDADKEVYVTAEEITALKENFQREMSRLESEIKEKDDKIEQLQKKVDVTDPVKNEYVNQINNKTQMIEQLVNHLPNITHKQGYIKEMIQDNSGTSFMIDYAVMVGNDGYSPNNFHVENENEEYVKAIAAGDVETYVLDGTLLHAADRDRFNDKVKEYKRLFNLYFIEDELILAAEQYLP